MFTLFLQQSLSSDVSSIIRSDLILSPRSFAGLHRAKSPDYSYPCFSDLLVCAVWTPSGVEGVSRQEGLGRL